MGRKRKLVDLLKRRRADIACIQKTKWKGTKSCEMDGGYKLLYGGILDVQNEVAIVISKKFRKPCRASQ